MGKLIEGKWSTEGYTHDKQGRFVRDSTQFDRRVTADGSSGFPAGAGRYHLYVSLACPWAHRTLIIRRLKRLDSAVSVSVVAPHMGEYGWEFLDFPAATPDTVNGARYLHEVYTKAKPDYTGRVTVPVLWDKQTGSIVNNDSRAILRMLDTEFNAFGDASVDLCPAQSKQAIDAEIDALLGPVNNGVYRAGFAKSQAAYDEAVSELFDALDGYERRLESQRFLLGSALTEADICLFTTLIRFDAVYHYHFKCNLARITDYPHLSRYLRDLYDTPGIAVDVNLEHIKHHYYTSHPHINPSGIIPKGPRLELVRR